MWVVAMVCHTIGFGFWQSPSKVVLCPYPTAFKKNIISSNKIVFCFDEMFEFHIIKLKNWQLLKWWHSSSYWNMKFNVFKRNLCELWISWQNHYFEIIILSGFALKIKWLVLIIFYNLSLKSYPNIYHLILLCDFVIMNIDKA